MIPYIPTPTGHHKQIGGKILISDIQSGIIKVHGGPDYRRFDVVNNLQCKQGCADCDRLYAGTLFSTVQEDRLVYVKIMYNTLFCCKCELRSMSIATALVKQQVLITDSTEFKKLLKLDHEILFTGVIRLDKDTSYYKGPRAPDDFMRAVLETEAILAQSRANGEIRDISTVATDELNYMQVTTPHNQVMVLSDARQYQEFIDSWESYLRNRRGPSYAIRHAHRSKMQAQDNK